MRRLLARKQSSSYNIPIVIIRRQRGLPLISPGRRSFDPYLPKRPGGLRYNALKTLECLAVKYNDMEVAENCKKVAIKHKKIFNKVFYNEKKKCLFDVLGNEKIRPNQLFAFSLTYPVWNLKSETTMEIFETITEKLLLKHGLRTLSKNDKDYIPVYEGDSFKRDMSYHQGIQWPWLLGLYFDALTNLINNEKNKVKKEKLIEQYNKFIQNVYSIFKKEINNKDCIGSISEVYDAKSPHKPGGTCAQAWSVSEVLRIVVEYRKLL